MPDFPRVSVVICNHNYGHFIDEAIRSALEQTLPAAEVVLVDDGSTDNSVEVARRHGDRIRIIQQPNGGQMAAYNTGFDHVTGDVVLFLDSDDKLLPGALSEVAKAMVDPEVARVHFKLELIDVGGQALGGVIPTQLAEGDLSALVRQGVLFLAAPGSGNAYRVEALRRVMPLPVSEQERHGADFFAGYASAFVGKVRALNQVLGQYRIHQTNDTQSLRFGNARLGLRGSQMIQARYRHLKQWLDRRLPNEQLADVAVVDFSIRKQEYAAAVFCDQGYLAGVKAGLAGLPALNRSIWGRECGWPMKLGLTSWALFVLFAPRGIGLPIARYVCNPSSRRQLLGTRGMF